MAELDSTPQVGGGCRPAASPRSVPAPSVVPAAPTPSPTSAAAGSDRTVGRAESTARRRWFQRPGAIIGAAAAAVVLIAGAIIGIGWTGTNGWGAQREMTAIAEAPDAQSQTLEVQGGGEITLVSSADTRGNQGVMIKGLPELGGDSIELWYIDNAGAESAGTFDAPAVGDMAGARGLLPRRAGHRDHGGARRRFSATHDRTHRRHRHVVGFPQSTPAGAPVLG